MTQAIAEQTHRYQRWDGHLNKGRWTWLAMVTTGLRLAFHERKTRTLVMTVWAVALGNCIMLYVLSLLEVLAGTPEAQGATDFVRTMLGVDISGVARIEEYREMLWRALFFVVIKLELFWVLVVVSRVGPPLIAQDLKYRALPIYFAKPVTPLTYITGKWLIIAAFIASVTILPNLFSLGAGVLITGGLHSSSQTLGLAVDVVLSGALVCVVGGAIILALSSLTADHRFVTVGWLAICILPVIGQKIMVETLPADVTTQWLGCVSLRDNILTLTDWLLGLRASLESSGLPAEAFNRALHRPVRVSCAATVMAGWTLVAMLVTYWRIVRFSKSAANL